MELRSCSQAVCKTVWQIPLLCVQWKTPDDGQRNCPKHAEFHSKNRYEKLVRLVGFIIRIYHDARSHERQDRLCLYPVSETVLNCTQYWVWPVKNTVHHIWWSLSRRMFTNFGTRLFYWSNHLLVYHQISFLGKFTKLQEATVSFVNSVRPSVRPHGTARRLPLDGCSWNLIFEYFSKIFWEKWSFVMIWQDNGYFTFTSVILSCWILLRMRNASDTSCRENRYTQCSTFPRKSCNTALAICILHN
jgi:hypothetical protein